jgi:hypothetical protein
MDRIEELLLNSRQKWNQVLPGEFATFDREDGKWICLGQQWQGASQSFSPRGWVVSGTKNKLPCRPAEVYGCANEPCNSGIKLAGRRLERLYLQACMNFQVNPTTDGWVTQVNEILANWQALKGRTKNVQNGRFASYWTKAKNGEIVVKVAYNIVSSAERPGGLGPLISVDLSRLWKGSGKAAKRIILSESPANNKYL